MIILRNTPLSLLMVMLLSLPLFSAEDFDDNSGGENANKQRSYLYDQKRNNYQAPDDLKVNRYYLDFYNRKSQIKEVKQKQQSINREFQEFNDLSIATHVKKIPFKPIDFLQVHPTLPTSVILPNDVLITYVDVQPETVVPEYDFNYLEIKPTPDLTKSAITLKYIYDNDTKEKKQVHTMKLIVDRYVQTSENDKTLYTMIEYVREDKIEPTDLLEYYFKQYGKYPQNNDAITINGRVYQFIEDSINGVVSIEDKKFRIKRGN